MIGLESLHNGIQSGTDTISHTYVRYLLSSIWTRVRIY